MSPGTLVKMTQRLRENLRRNDCSEHVDEFGSCVGIVQGLASWGDGSSGPEVDVRWQPSNLRYAYDPDLLEVVDSLA